MRMMKSNALMVVFNPMDIVIQLFYDHKGDCHERVSTIEEALHHTYHMVGSNRNLLCV